MRRIFLWVLCCVLLACPVLAASGVTSAESQTVVNSDGNCQVSLTLTLQLDAPDSDLALPLPENARDITLNGGAAETYSGDSARYVRLSGVASTVGIHTVSLSYILPDAVSAGKKGALNLDLELLSGFSYPISNFSFTVTLPGKVEGKPVFSSTYYQETVDELVNFTLRDDQIRGSVTQVLMDHEVLALTLPVSEKMFPQNAVKRWSMDTMDLMMLLCGVLALIYWLVGLRCAPVRGERHTAVPQGFTAGEIGCQLTGSRADFTMTVLTWAQMGYLQIQKDSLGRVMLHKRMDMGNERSDFEVRVFKALFGRRRTVDGTGYHYAQLCRKVSSSCPARRSYYRRGGSTRIFRLLAAGVGLIGGICLAGAFVQDTAWQILLSILLGTVGAVISWVIQSGSEGLLLRHRGRLYLAMGCSLLWLLLCFWAGEVTVALFVLGCQWLAGLAACFGGIRTDLGKQTAAEILGLRRYMKTVHKKELLRILKSNPDYYYALAPYAMALGIDRSFAARLGKLQLPPCSYLTTGTDGHMTAREWNQLLRDAVAALDERQLRLPYERILGK